MAKKNIHALMNGIIGSAPSPAKTPAAVDADIPSAPKSNSHPSSDDTRATFIVPAHLVKKIKFIAVMEDRMQKDIVRDALAEYVGRWEKENSEINLNRK